MNRCAALALLLGLLAACGGQAAPTPDLVTLREQIVQDVLAELTASAPTATQTPEPTLTQPPTLTASPSNTATRTATASHTPSALPPTSTATGTPVPTQPLPTAGATASPRPAASPAPAQPTALPAAARAGTIAFSVYEPAADGYTLYTLTADDALHVIANHVHHPDINPDGQIIVVDGTGAGKEDIWALVLASGEWRHLTNYLDDHYPTWSGNGQKIGFSSSRQGDGVYRLYVGDALISTDRSGFVVGDYPVLLSTGDMVFAGCDYGWGTGSRCGTWLASAGTSPRRLTDNPLDIPTDANASDMLFLRPQGDDWDIYRVGYGGGGPMPVFPSPARDGPAALSPDGKSLAFLSDRSGSWALYTATLQGGQPQKIQDLPPGVNVDRAPYPWWSERISWGPGPIFPTATPTPFGGVPLPAPKVSFPIPDDTVSATRATLVQWAWSRTLEPNQGFMVRFWHGSDAPSAVAAPATGTQLEVWFGLTDAYRRYGDDFYYLDVVVVDTDSNRVASESAPIRVKADSNK